ncbi:hypothetical protein [Gemella sp. zg-1178]|nr:hypothetical protein [Gemella sp. zg-1178]
MKKETEIKFDNNFYTDILKEQVKEKDKHILEFTKLLDQHKNFY